MCAILRHPQADGRTDTARSASHQHHMARKLTLWWCQFELVLFQRPIFDGVALGIVQRDEATTRFCATHDRNCTMVELSGDIGHCSVFTGGEHPHARDQDHAWVRIRCGIVRALDGYGGIGIKVLPLVCLKIATIFCNIRLHTCAQGGYKFLTTLFWLPIDEPGPG